MKKLGFALFLLVEDLAMESVALVEVLDVDEQRAVGDVLAVSGRRFGRNAGLAD